jgi:MFS transporter, PAT family, beta-lactamase induction signal transducer AmpG
MAGWLIPRIGMMSSLVIGTVAGPASHLALALLAAHGGDGGKAFWTFALAVGVEGFAYAFASIVLITYMSTLASVEHAASQFGLLTSLCAFPGSILAGFSGFVIEHSGFVWFFIWTSLIGIPVALSAVFVWCRAGISDEAPLQVGQRH